MPAFFSNLSSRIEDVFLPRLIFTNSADFWIMENKIINRCINLFDEDLTEHLKTTITQVLKQLFKKATTASSNQDEQKLFASYQQLKKNGKGIILSTKSELKDITRFIFEKQASQGKASGLSLVGEEELGLNLALSQMESSLEVVAHAELFTLEKRMNVLFFDADIEQHNMPFAPASLTWVFNNVFSKTQVELAVKAQILEHLTKLLSKEINTTYNKLNQVFIKAGILPNITAELVREKEESQADAEQQQDENDANQGDMVPQEGSSSGTAPVDGVSMNYGHGGGDSAQSGEGSQPSLDSPSAAAFDSETQQLVESIMQLLTVDSEQAAGSPPPKTNPNAVIKPNDFDQALQQVGQQKNIPAGSAGIPELKKELTEQVKNNTGNYYPQLSGKQEKTIELMGMVYDEIDRDNQLDRNIRSSFDTINIPLLRLAMNDEQFFADQNHPARRYMELLIRSSQRWHGTDVIKKVHRYSDTAAKSFDGSGRSFEQAGKDLHKFLDHREKRAEMAEQKWINAAKGKEKMELTKGRVDAHMQRWLKDCDIPFIQDVLKNIWEDALTLTLLREGEDSEKWDKKRKAAESLSKLGSKVKSKQLSGADKLEAMHQLDETMDELGFSKRDRQNTKDNIHTCIDWEQQPLKDEEGGPELKKILSIDSAKKDREIQEKKQRTKKIEQIRELTDEEKKQMERLAATAYGTLFDFFSSQQDFERRKLSWVSTISKNILFVDLTGRKSHKLSLPRVAIDVVRKNIKQVVFEEKNYFQKALSGVMNRLKKLAT